MRTWTSNVLFKRCRPQTDFCACRVDACAKAWPGNQNQWSMKAPANVPKASPDIVIARGVVQLLAIKVYPYHGIACAQVGNSCMQQQSSGLFAMLWHEAMQQYSTASRNSTLEKFYSVFPACARHDAVHCDSLKSILTESSTNPST